MAKPTRPVSPPQAADAEENVRGGHPLMRNMPQVDDLMAAARARKAHKEFQITELEQWSDAVNGLASTPNGKLFLKSMLQFSGIFDPANIRDTMGMVDAGIKAAFYMKWVRPHLNPDLRSSIE